MTALTVQEVLAIALPLFLIMDPIGNGVICLSMLPDMTPARQRAVILRELLFALVVIVGFQFLGDWLLGLLDIRQSTLRLAGGVILFLVSIKMVFPGADGQGFSGGTKDPFFVPIAVPLIAGPSLLATVMLYARSEDKALALLAGEFSAWAATAVLMVLAPTLTRVLGPKVMRAGERLMGLILVLLSVQMIEDGIRLFIREI